MTRQAANDPLCAALRPGAPLRLLVRVERGLRPAAGRRLVACAVCGSGSVEKDLMAPAVAGAGARAARSRPRPRRPSRRSPSSAAASRRTSEDVGRNFASEARAIHEGERPQRSIIGEARPAEARALHRGRHPGRPAALVLGASPTDHSPRPRARLGSAKRGTPHDRHPGQRPRRHHRRRRLRLLGRLSSGEARLDRHRAARAQAADLAARPGTPPA